MITVVKSNKKPAERRNEFITVSEELFLEKGFENTTVDDIVGRMGVAKGLFYYYFDSKEDLLMTISERLVDEVLSSISAAMEKKGLTAVERFMVLLPANSDISSRSRTLIAYFHKERNRAFHHLMKKRGREFMVPAIEQIIIQGVEEGVFSVKYPRETSVALEAVMSAMTEIFRQNPQPRAPDREAEIALDLMERILGAKPGSLDAIRESFAPACSRRAANCQN